MDEGHRSGPPYKESTLAILRPAYPGIDVAPYRAAMA